jgi:hypothetical protein
MSAQSGGKKTASGINLTRLRSANLAVPTIRLARAVRGKRSALTRAAEQPRAAP